MASVNELIPGSVVNVAEAYQFKKIYYKSQTFYSKACTKVEKRNSYTISYLNGNGELSFGVILRFLKVVLDHSEENAYYLAVVQQLKESEDGLLTTSSNGIHLKPVNYDRY